MNTFLWGPPLWKLVHSLAYCAKASDADDVALFFNSFKKVLPCVYCRRSFEEFDNTLRVKYNNQPLVSIIRKKQLFAWSYYLHDLVNEKLDRQEVEKQNNNGIRSSSSLNAAAIVAPRTLAPTTATTAPAPLTLRAKQLSFECLEKKHVLHPVSVTVTDLFDILFIFAMNYPEDDKDEELVVKRQAYKQFLCTLPHVLTILIQHGDPLIRIRQDPLFYFLQHFKALITKKALCEEVASGVLRSRKNMFCAILIVWAKFYQHDIRQPAEARRLYNALTKRYSIAQAKACKHGSCL